MINKYFFYGCLFALLASCAQEPAPLSQPQPPRLQTYTGMIRFDRGFSNFTDCSSGKLYLLADSTKTIGPLHYRACQPAQCPEEKVFAKVMARLFPGTGNAQNDPGTLGVVEVLELSAATPANTCIPFEYWCSDEQNTWSLLLSLENNRAFFKDLTENKGATFHWKSPTQTEEGSIYLLQNTLQPSDQLRLVVQSKPCTGKQGATKAIVHYRGKQYLGCAQKN